MFGLFRVVEDYLSKGTSNNASLFEEGGGVESDNFILKRIIKDKGVVYAKSHESEVDGIGWIPSGETVYNKDGINIKVDSVQDIAHYADISLSDGVWTYTPSEEGAEIQYYIHTTHTANGNLVFTVYDFIVEWSDEFKYDEDGNKVDTFGIDLLEQDCQKINSENGLGEFNTQTNFQLYKYQNKFIEDESEKIYANGGYVGMDESQKKRLKGIEKHIKLYKSSGRGIWITQDGDKMDIFQIGGFKGVPKWFIDEMAEKYNEKEAPYK